MDAVEKLMEGAYDAHLHASPGLTQRRKTIIEIAEEARSYRMKGLVFKDHQFSTAPVSQIMKSIVPELNVIGGITLAASVGGVNPAAVEANFKLGGRVVWMFSLESAWMLRRINSPDFASGALYRNVGVKSENTGLTILKTDSEELKEEAKEIVSLCKQYNAVLETSHLSREEGFAIVKEAKNQGHKKVVITHANASVTPLTVDDQLQFISLGAHLMYCMNVYQVKPTENAEPFTGLVKLIEAVNPKNVILGTDFGIRFLPSAPEGIRMMITGFLELGMTEDDIRMMVQTNTEKLYVE
jgi:hypothetical protein